MNKTQRIILFILYVLFNLITEWYIINLFPYTGLGGLICLPTTIIVSLILGFLLCKIIKSHYRLWLSIFIITTFIITQTFIQLALLPQEFRGSPFKQISNAILAYKNYDNIKIGDFWDLSDANRVVYIYKYKSILPSKYILLTIDSLKNESESTHPKIYKLKKINAKYDYDTTKLKIIESDTSTIIKEYLISDTLIYRMHPNFIKSNGGYNDRIISIYTRPDDLKIDSGIDRLLYNILQYTKIAYR